MKSVTLLSLVMMTCSSSFTVISATELTLVLNDPLTGADPVGIEIGKVVRGGAYLSDGWQCQGQNDQIRIHIPEDIFPGDRGGAMEVDIRNFDPLNQYQSNKHQFINLYSRPDGSKAAWDEPGKAWWNIRGGTNYMRNGGAGVKWLWAGAGIDSRHEVRLIHSRNDWDRAETHTWRVEWTQDQATLLLDGQILKSNVSFGNRSEALQYIFLGKDNVYKGMPSSDGIIYTALRLYVEGGNPDNEPPIISGTTKTPDDFVTGTTVELGVLASDPNGDPLTYNWEANTRPAGSNPAIPTGPNPTVTFDKAGDYLFTVTVSDGFLSDTATLPVTVVQQISGLSVAP